METYLVLTWGMMAAVAYMEPRCTPLWDGCWGLEYRAPHLALPCNQLQGVCQGLWACCPVLGWGWL